jgi:hypothetical protein
LRVQRRADKLAGTLFTERKVWRKVTCILDRAFEERNSIKIQEKAERVLVLRAWEVFLEVVVREVPNSVEP